MFYCIIAVARFWGLSSLPRKDCSNNAFFSFAEDVAGVLFTKMHRGINYLTVLFARRLDGITDSDHKNGLMKIRAVTLWTVVSKQNGVSLS